MNDLGAFVLIPTLLVFILAVATHRPIESLIAAFISTISYVLLGYS